MEKQADQQQIRLDKLNKIRDLGAEPYPYSFQRSHTIPDIIEQAEELLKKEEQITIAGRLLAVRSKGKASFGNIQAQHTRIQMSVRMKSEIQNSKCLSCLTSVIILVFQEH
jgi:lysyl-tRNA synthetase class 2